MSRGLLHSMLAAAAAIGAFGDQIRLAKSVGAGGSFNGGRSSGAAAAKRAARKRRNIVKHPRGAA